MYQIGIRHDELNKYRLIKGNDRYVVEQKARAQLAQWDEMWERRVAAEERRARKEQNAWERRVAAEERRARKEQNAAERRAQKEKLAADRERKKRLAADRTRDAQAAITASRHLLRDTLSVNDAIDWEKLKDDSQFDKPCPVLPPEPSPPPKLARPPAPDGSDRKYAPPIGILGRLFPRRWDAKMAAGKARFQADHAAWRRKVESLSTREKTEGEEYRAAHRVWKAQVDKLLAQWEGQRKEFESEQAVRNAAIDQRRDEYLARAPRAIQEYCEFVLWRSRYPESFPRNYEIEYVEPTRTVIVDFTLPGPQHLPRVAEVRYVQSEDEFREVALDGADLDELFDDVLYQVALRTIHELYEADVAQAIDSVAFNGYVDSIDQATGKEAHSCVLSLQTKRDEFLAINLANVVPKACFKKLKGVAAAQLHSLTPVAPIVQMNREDKRFIAARGVVQEVNEGFNLAAMDWADFEHLIREVFEREFAESGGEVKVTRASRDGGVDAVAFDPDPIRGGKIVIQAKRYTNTVGVSAVRDLYGTVVNEGATKGILVTTADYGPDAYEFARDKPLTLLNGSNLLHLLEKHGHRARIDLKEARQVLAAQARDRENTGGTSS